MATHDTLDSVKVARIIEDLRDTRLTERDKAVLVSSWIFENFGATRRTFRYSEPLDRDDEDCVARFARSFAHQDWVDGESVVQAEQTSAEDGFNQRFHQIEDDLDALSADVRTAFDCLAEMRASLAGLLDEVRVELNRINADLHECCSTSSTARPTAERTAVFGNLIRTGRLVGTARFGEKDVNVWETPQGMIMLPRTTVVGVSARSDVRLKSAGELARIVAENPDIPRFFAERTVTKRELVRRFGSVRGEDGRTVGELVAVLPDTTQRADLDKLVTALAETEARVLMSSQGTAEAVAISLGVDRDDAAVADAPVSRLDDVPSNVVSAVEGGGIATIGQLADATPEQITTILRRARVTATAAEIAGWRATAITLKTIRR